MKERLNNVCERERTQWRIVLTNSIYGWCKHYVKLIFSNFQNANSSGIDLDKVNGCHISFNGRNLNCVCGDHGQLHVHFFLLIFYFSFKLNL